MGQSSVKAKLLGIRVEQSFARISGYPGLMSLLELVGVTKGVATSPYIGEYKLGLPRFKTAAVESSVIRKLRQVTKELFEVKFLERIA